MSHNTFDTNDQFTVSFELLHLMQWLVEHDPEGLKRLIARALTQGLQEKINHSQGEQQHPDNMQNNIVDFLLLLEALLFEAINEHSVKSVLQRNLIPSVNRIDAAACDNSTVRFSLERATSQMQLNPQENPRDLLMKELIKRWKPHKKNIAS